MSNGLKAPAMPRGRRPTPKEAERAKRLVREGMSPALARAEVLGRTAGRPERTIDRGEGGR